MIVSYTFKMRLKVDFYKFDQHIGAVDFDGLLGEAEKQAVAGLARLRADRAKISDRAPGGKTVMVIAA
jgi:hypothetical protein